MKTKFFLSLLVISLVLVGCSPAASTPSATTAPTEAQIPTIEPTEVPTYAPTEVVIAPTQVSLEPATIKVGILPYSAFTPQIIAQEEGFFAAQGLTVEFVDFKQANEPLIALAAGDIDVASGILDVASLNAIAQGINLKLVGDEGFVDPNADCAYSSWIVKKDDLANGRFDNISNLAGMNVGFRKGGMIEYALYRLLEMGNLSMDDVNLTNVPPQNINESVINGALDFAHDGEPLLTLALKTGSLAIWQPFNDYLPDQQFGAVWFGPNILDGNQDIGKRFMVAYLQGIRQYNQGKTDRNVELMAQLTKSEPAFIKQTCWQSFRNDGSVNMPTVLEFQQWAVDSGYMDKVLTEAEIWDPAFIDYANQILQ